MKENFGIAVLAILCGLMIIVLVFGLTFVVDRFLMNPEKYTSTSENRFIKLQDWKDNFIMYDKETGVQYFIFNGGITVLLDDEGRPLLYQGE